MKSAMDLEDELKHLIVETLMLEDITPAEIESDIPLFVDGVGLDSIDALELGMAISRKYKVNLSKDQKENVVIFASVRNLAGYVWSKLQEQGSAP